MFWFQAASVPSDAERGEVEAGGAGKTGQEARSGYGPTAPAEPAVSSTTASVAKAAVATPIATARRGGRPAEGRDGVGAAMSSACRGRRGREVARESFADGQLADRQIVDLELLDFHPFEGRPVDLEPADREAPDRKAADRRRPDRGGPDGQRSDRLRPTCLDRGRGSRAGDSGSGQRSDRLGGAGYRRQRRGRLARHAATVPPRGSTLAGVVIDST